MNQYAMPLHCIGPRLPVLLMTGYADLRTSALDGIEWLAKPLRREILARALENRLARTA